MLNKHERIYSKHLGHDFDFHSFGGFGGKPVIVFPSADGHWMDYMEGIGGMRSVLEGYINNRDIVVFCVDGRDWDGWRAKDWSKDSGANHRNYELCITQEVIPHIMHNYNINEKFLSTGVSGGGYHCINFLLKFPELFDSTISLSGVYSMDTFSERPHHGSAKFYNDPLEYSKHLHGDQLGRLHDAYVVIGQGGGEDELWKREAGTLINNLKGKGITCWHDVWGNDINHDWPTWKMMMVHFLDHMKAGVEFPRAPGGRRTIVGYHRYKNPIF